METPSVDICVMNPETGLCEGCGRAIAEIAAWASLSSAERRRIMDELGKRRPATAPR